MTHNIQKDPFSVHLLCEFDNRGSKVRVRMTHNIQKDPFSVHLLCEFDNRGSKVSWESANDT